MKNKLGITNCLYPMPCIIVGAHVAGRPNFITIANEGSIAVKYIVISMDKHHFTNAGIKENLEFSVNIPSIDLVETVDYIGMNSGRNINKSNLFDLFYGQLKNAPMINNCPITMACRLTQTLNFPTHDIFIGEIIDTYCEEDCMTGNVLDFKKINPLLFVMNDRHYWSIGAQVTRAFRATQELETS